MTAILARHGMTPRDGAMADPARALRGAWTASTEARGVLLLGNYRPTLWVARALAGQGWRVVVGRGGGEGCTEYSRSVAEMWDHPDLERSPTGFMAALRAFLRRRPDIAIVYPVAEAFVTALAAAGGRLPAGVTLASVKAETVARCQDKHAMLRCAQSAGVALEPFRIAAGHDAVIREARKVGFPIVIRPLRPGLRFGHKKALICADASEIAAALPAWPRDRGALLLQRQARGARHNVFFAARQGRLLRAVETKILRTDHADGTGLAVEGITVAPSAELIADTARLAAALDYTGVGLAQFIVDAETGRRCFIELNPRIAGSHAITEQVGAGLAHLAVDLALENPSDQPEEAFHYPEGIRYAWTYGDLRGLKSALSAGEISPLQALGWAARGAACLLRAPRHMTWAWSDPLPTLMLFARLAMGSGSRSPRSSAPLAQGTV